MNKKAVLNRLNDIEYKYGVRKPEYIDFSYSFIDCDGKITPGKTYKIPVDNRLKR